MKPTNPFFITQKFGANANTYYAEGGLKGHTGLDCQTTYGQQIFSAFDGYVYSLLNQNNPDLMKYRAVFTLSEIGGKWYEVSYGHLIDMHVKKGQTVKAGDKIGTAGNTGDVASGGVKVTKAEKEAGSTKGTHLHFQMRALTPVYTLSETKGKNPIYDGAKLVNYKGMYFIPINYDGGYKGCIDPEPFLLSNEKVINTDKFKDLQILLNKYGAKLTVDGLFGSKSKQAFNDIYPNLL